MTDKSTTEGPIADHEFGKLDELGFVSDYIQMQKNEDDQWRMIPIITAAGALAQGFFPKGTKVHWVDHNGYPYQRDMAREKIGAGTVLTVRQCRIGRSSSTYEFDEIEGHWNSVMFEKIDG